MSRYILNRINDSIWHSDFRKIVAQIKRFNQYDYTTRKEIQNRELEKYLSYASKKIPYYSALLNPEPYVVRDHLNVDQFLTIPLLTKDIIRRDYLNLINDDHSLKSRVNTSGGSTGEPVKLLQCSNYQLWTKAYKRFYLIKAGGREYNKLLTIWGSERDILEPSIDLWKKARNYLRMKKTLNAFKMTQEDLVNFATVINNYKPDVIEAYVHSIYEIAKYVNKKKVTLYKPQGIIVSAGTFHDFMEDEIKQAFGVPIYNRYGSREMGDMACSCGGKDSLHISMLTHYIEVADDKGEPLPDGEIGDIVVTSLTNYAMPLIRYMIGDRGVLRRNTTCSYCGWHGDILEEVTGRSVDVFKSKDGAHVAGGYFNHIFFFREWVKKFQVIQENKNEMTINIVKEDSYDSIPSEEQIEINDAIHKVMPDIILKWKEVPDIEYDRSGKFRFLISKVTD